MGAHLVQRLRDDYPLSAILNFAVWPYLQGEVVLQNYNLLLTLSELIQTSDGVVTIFNDQVLRICQQLLNCKRPSYSQLNSVIAQQMVSILYPSSNTESRLCSLWQNYNPLRQITDTVCSQEQFKLLQLLQIPQCSLASRNFSADLWEGLSTRLKQMVLTNSSEAKINWSVKPSQRHKAIKSVANFVCVRG